MENYKGFCVYHPNELECDRHADVWADHDEDCHGPIDTKENREDLPEGFRWGCCDGEGDADGCVEGRHLAKVEQGQGQKRRLY